MQLDRIGPGTPHARDELACRHLIALSGEQFIVVTISAEVGVIVLDDDQRTVARHAGTRIHDNARGAGSHRITTGTREIDTLVHVFGV